MLLDPLDDIGDKQVMYLSFQQLFISLLDECFLCFFFFHIRMHVCNILSIYLACCTHNDDENDDDELMSKSFHHLHYSRFFAHFFRFRLYDDSCHRFFSLLIFMLKIHLSYPILWTLSLSFSLSRFIIHSIQDCCSIIINSQNWWHSFDEKPEPSTMSTIHSGYSERYFFLFSFFRLTTTQRKPVVLIIPITSTIIFFCKEMMIS